MKKLLMVLILVAVIATGTAFADASHPDGLGIGVLWRGGMGWHGGGFNPGGAALALKLPAVPIYWGINFGFGNDWFSLGVTGDKYLLGGALVSDFLYWYLGVGGYLGFSTWNNGPNSGDARLGFGARLPIGISLQLAKRVMEVYAEAAPSVGVGIATAGSAWVGLDGGFHIAIGFRIWL